MFGRSPLGARALKHEVVFKKSENCHSREIKNLFRRTTPEGSTHGNDVFITKPMRETLRIDPLAKCDLAQSRITVLGHGCSGKCFKAEDFEKAAPRAGHKERSPSREDSARRPFVVPAITEASCSNR
mmetsp:Transcript_9950/g.26381  ORF Transcript_9950/g.26381 Transcript_9950/m.26381 type:complete len:127 (+) Transcript_9950:126-506(+)